MVHRHGPMVLGVCRRMLPSAHDAEDAFQATFLILARRAASIGRREQLANWLYGVAVRTAKEARRRAARQHARERRLMNVSHVEVVNAPDEDQRDLLSLLDEELNRLPPRYRIALVACELEGKSRREAAQQLGVPEGTLSTHLARGRKLLRDRLLRRGVSLGAGPFAGLARPITTITVSERLAGSTVRAALGYTSGGLAAGDNPGNRHVIGRRSTQDDVGDEARCVDRIPGGPWPDRGRHRGRCPQRTERVPLMAQAQAQTAPKLKTSIKPAHEVAVHVVDRDGKPVSDALVTVLDQGKPAADGRTDAHGKWKVRVIVDSKDWAIFARKAKVGFDYAIAGESGNANALEAPAGPVDPHAGRCANRAGQGRRSRWQADCRSERRESPRCIKRITNGSTIGSPLTPRSGRRRTRTESRCSTGCRNSSAAGWDWSSTPKASMRSRQPGCRADRPC